jgi:hypothetical protein
VKGVGMSFWMIISKKAILVEKYERLRGDMLIMLGKGEFDTLQTYLFNNYGVIFSSLPARLILMNGE